MTDRSTEDLVRQLVQNLPPVKPIAALARLCSGRIRLRSRFCWG
jgi:hypothetical protein